MGNLVPTTGFPTAFGRRNLEEQATERPCLAEVYQRDDGTYDAVLIFKGFDDPDEAIDFVNSLIDMVATPTGTPN